MSCTGPGLTGKAAAEVQAAHPGLISSVQEQSNCEDPLANVCSFTKHEDRRQSPRFIHSFGSVCRSTSSSSTHLLKTCGVRTPQILSSLIGDPKGSLGLLTSFLCWLFPNVFVALVFAVTLIGCLICNATIAFDLCFLLLLIASWVLLAVVASKRGLLVFRGIPRGSPGGPLTTSSVCDALKEVSCGDELTAAAAAQGPLQLLPKSDAGGEGLCVSFEKDERFHAGWEGPTTTSCKGPALNGALLLRSSSSIGSYKTSATRSDLRDDACGNVEEEPEEGTPEHSFGALADNGAPMQFIDTEMQQLQHASYSLKAAAEETAAAAGVETEDEEEVAQAAAGDLFSFFDGEEGVRTPEDREPDLAGTEETEETEQSNDEWKERARLTCDYVSPLFTPATSSSSSSTKLSCWLGPMREVALSSSHTGLSFCRSQTLAAASLAPEEQQDLSSELEVPPLPAFPLSSLDDDDDADAKETPCSQPSDLRQTGHFGAAGAPLQHGGNPQELLDDTSFALGLPNEKLHKAPASLGERPTAETMLLQQQLQQQMQQQQQQMHGSFVSTSPRAASPAAPQRRSGVPRRVGGPPGGTKSQKRESRAALQYYMGLVKDCCKRRDGAGALRVLEEVQREGRVAPDVQLLNYVLFACVASQDTFLTKRLFEFIEDAGVADIVTYNTMLKSFSLSGELEEAEKILKRMRTRNVPPDEVSFNLLVNAAVTCGRIDRAWHYVDEIKTAHMVPDKFTISSLVKSLQPGQNPKLIRRTLRLMDGIDVCEDLILLSTCIDATMRLGDTERLRRLLQSFEASSLSPNAHAYGTLIKAYGRLGNISKVWGLWRDLKSKKNMEPTNYTYGCMLDILLSYNLLADATQLFCQMVQQGVVHAVHFSILVKGLSKYNERGVRLALEAYAVLQSSAAIRQGGGAGGETAGKGGRGRGKKEKNQAQVALNTISFNALLHLCVVNGRMADALVLFHDMECQDTIAPDLISYSTVIKGLCCCPGDAPLERALSLLDQMQKRYGIQPDAIVFNTLIQGAATRKNPALVEHLLNLMQQANVPPSSYTLCQCVKLYGKCNNLQRALELANELPSRFGFSVDGYVYSALIAACVSNGAVVLAGQLALQASSSGIEIPPAVLCRLWNTLHFTKVTMQQENGEHSGELNAVHEALWKLVGPANSKDATTISPEGLGMRRLRRRGGKQANNNIPARQKQQQSGNSNSHIVSGVSSSLSDNQQLQLNPQGTVNSFVSAVQTEWEDFREPAMMGGNARDNQLELAGAAAFWNDANASNNNNNNLPWWRRTDTNKEEVRS